MEFNTKLNKLIARRKVIETRKRLNKIVQSPFEINNTLKTVYQNNVVDNNKKYIITRQDYCRNFVTINFDVIKATTRKSYNINKYRNKLIDKQRSRKYINVYLDSLREFYNLTNNEKNVLLYINSIYNKTETYFIVNSIFYNDCEDKTKVPISSIKSVLYSLKKKGFISNYKDKHNNIIKGCYIIK